MLKRGFTRFVSVFYLLVAARDIPVMTNPSRQFVTRRRSVVYWYCTGTQFSKLSTAVDTSAAAACNVWCVCVCVFWRSRILRMSPPLSFPAPQLSHFALCHPDLLQAPPQPLQSPPSFHFCPSSPFGHVDFTSPLHPGFYYTHLM